MINRFFMNKFILNNNKLIINLQFRLCNNENLSLNIEEDLLKQKNLKKEFELPEKKIYNEYYQNEKGFIYDKKPVKVKCIKNKMYMWCSCGYSKFQPFCDGTHKIAHYKINLKPYPFKCKETKEYWLCNCKQSKNKPFCDGTHKEIFVQNADSFIKF